jgi:hypothetical protein
MNNDSTREGMMKQNKVVPLVIGGMFGAVLGVVAAFLFLRGNKDKETKTKISPSQGLKAGMGIVSLLKMISELGKK